MFLKRFLFVLAWWSHSSQWYLTNLWCYFVAQLDQSFFLIFNMIWIYTPMVKMSKAASTTFISQWGLWGAYGLCLCSLYQKWKSENPLDLGFGDFYFLCIRHIVAKNGEKWGPQSKDMANLSKRVRVKIVKIGQNPCLRAKRQLTSAFFSTWPLEQVGHFWKGIGLDFLSSKGHHSSFFCWPENSLGPYGPPMGLIGFHRAWVL